MGKTKLMVVGIICILLLTACGKSTDESLVDNNSTTVVESLVEDSKVELAGEIVGTNEESNELSQAIAKSINDALSNKENYPSITSIEVTDDASLFTVTFSSRELSLYETTLRMSLYMVGTEFQREAGLTEHVQVDYIDKSTGEVFSTGTSDDVELGD